MKYILLLRGINVGGKNKVVMKELKSQLEAEGFSDVSTYINSGNIFFYSEDSIESIKSGIENLLSENYSFDIPFALISASDYLKDVEKLPSWWGEDLARKDVLFYSDEVDVKTMHDSISVMPLNNEVIHYGDVAIYWGKYDEADYLKTSYHKNLLKQPFYKLITIRNGNTFNKIAELLRKE